MQLKKSIPVRIPVGIKDVILKEIRGKDINFPIHLQNVYWILGKITLIPSKNKKLEGLRMVPLCSRILKSEIGNHYKKYLDWLINIGILKSDYRYLPSKFFPGRGKCICYGFTDKYYKEKTEVVDVIKRSICKRQIIWNSKMLKKIINDPVLDNLNKTLKNIEFDHKGATNEIENLHKTNQITRKKYEIQLDRIDMLRRKEFYLVRCEYGRIHTNFTALTKSLRKFITIEGEQMVGLDIKSCQPALLYALLQSEWKTAQEVFGKGGEFLSICNLGDERQHYVGNGNYYEGSRDNLRLSWDKNNMKGFWGSGRWEDTVHLDVELDKFRDIISTGFYEWLGKEWDKKYKKRLKNRDRIKKMFYSFAFGVGKYGKIREIFDEHFPEITKMIDFIKGPDYRNLARMLQKKESEIVIGELCGDLLKKKETSRFYTVHDAIYVPKKLVDVVKGKFKEILIKNNVLSGISEG